MNVPPHRPVTLGQMYALIAVVIVGVAAMVFVQKWMQPPHYAGEISGLHGTSYGVDIDMDGRYPNQKMTVWIPARVYHDYFAGGGTLPKLGWKMKVLGETTQYRGRPEIVVNDIQSQMVWSDPNDHTDQ